MRSKGYDLDIPKNPLFLTAMMVIIWSIWSLTVMKADALSAPDKFGTDQPFSIADEDDDEVKLEQYMDRIAASLPFHYLGSLSYICRFTSIFSCIHLTHNLSAIGWMELLSQICLPSNRILRVVLWWIKLLFYPAALLWRFPIKIIFFRGFYYCIIAFIDN